MENALVFAFIVLLASLGGAGLGHFLTLRSINFVQPSASQIQETVTSSVTTEPDPWADQPPEEDEKKDYVSEKVASMIKAEKDFYNVGGDAGSDLEKIHTGVPTGKEVKDKVNPYTPGDNNEN